MRQKGCARPSKTKTSKSKKHSKKHSKKNIKRSSRKNTTTKRNKKRSRMSRMQMGGTLYTFDNTDMIGGLPAVKAVSECPPGVSMTDTDYGIKLYEKFNPQKGGMNRDGLRFDIIPDQFVQSK